MISWIHERIAYIQVIRLLICMVTNYANFYAQSNKFSNTYQYYNTVLHLVYMGYGGHAHYINISLVKCILLSSK